MSKPDYQFDQKVLVSRAEYTLLKEVRSISKKQSALLRVLEAEENLRKGNVIRTSIHGLLKSL